MYRRLLLEVEESPLLPGALHTKVVLLPTLPLASPPAEMFIFIALWQSFNGRCDIQNFQLFNNFERKYHFHFLFQ